MYRTPSSKEILTYFSEFLTQIGIVMTSIKKYMYDLIEVPMNSPKVSSVFNSMSSIIFSTHRTYSDLKKIESIIAGFTKSRIDKKTEWSLNSTNETQIRSKSQDSNLKQFVSYSKESTPMSKQSTNSTNFNIKSRSRVKKNVEQWTNPLKGCVYQSEYSFNRQTDAHNVTQKEVQLDESVLDNSSKCDLITIESKIKGLILKNRKVFQTISNRNKQCLDLINSAKQELFING